MRATEGQRWVVLIHGDLDISTQRHLASVADVLPRTGDGVDFDLAGVRFVDSAGWDGLTGALAALHRSDIPARLVNPSPAVQRLLARLPAAAASAA